MESKTTPQAVPSTAISTAGPCTTPSTAISTAASRTAAGTCRLDAMNEALCRVSRTCDKALESMDGTMLGQAEDTALAEKAIAEIAEQIRPFRRRSPLRVLRDDCCLNMTRFRAASRVKLCGVRQTGEGGQLWEINIDGQNWAAAEIAQDGKVVAFIEGPTRSKLEKMAVRCLLTILQERKRIHKLHHAGASAAAHAENGDHVAAVGHMPQEADDLN